MKNSIAKIISLALLIMTNSILISCSGDVTFKDDFGSTLDVKNLDNGNFEVTETFDIEKSSTRKVDIVWVIDNSGSMKAEAAHVRSNYLSFIDRLKQNADTKSVLISAEGDIGTQVRMPASIRGINHKQLNVPVSSFNAMCLAEMSLRSPSELQVNSPVVCDTPANYQSLSLDGFLRPTSQKVFVFVSDDNETHTTSTNFLSTFQQKYQQSPITYGFIGKGALSPCQARTGVGYEQLTSSSNGKTFNICDQDWTAHFDELTNHVIDSVKSSFSLTYSHLVDDAQITVRVDNTVLSPSQYTIANGLIRINESVLISTLDSIQITYVVDQLRD